MRPLRKDVVGVKFCHFVFFCNMGHLHPVYVSGKKTLNALVLLQYIYILSIINIHTLQ